MFATPTKTQPLRLHPALFFLLLLLLFPAVALGEGNRLLRIRVTPRQGLSRVTLLFRLPPEYTLDQLPGQVRLTIRGTDSPSFKGYRGHSDPNVGGIVCSQHGPDLRLLVRIRTDGQARVIPGADPQTLFLDVAPGKVAGRVEIVPGRESILKGTEKLVREFGAPLRAGLPFVPTDPKRLGQMLPEQETLLFQRGEDLVYREQGGDAVQVFNYFLTKAPAVRALASYRLGQAYHLLDRDEEALKAFQEGERLAPEFLERAPEVMEAYAEVLARRGDFAGGRALLSRLIARQAGSSYAAPLLNHLAAMHSRHGDEKAAQELFRSVMARFPGSSAAARARMKLVDRELFTQSPATYKTLKARYQTIYEAPGDNSLRDEALFKVALLEGLYGPAQDALASAITYERRYPRGMFVAVVRKMREELLLPVYQDIFAVHDEKRLVQLAVDNKEYLSVALADPQFARRLGDACHAAKLVTVELTLFSYLSEKNWAGACAPYLLERLVEDGHELGRLDVAEKAGRAYLARFPKGPKLQKIREHLGGIAFEKGELKEAAAQLGFLNGKKVRAEIPQSDYYLGKGLIAGGDLRGGERALSRFAQNAPGGSPLLPDTYFTLAAARVSLKDAAGAIVAYREGLKFASGATAEQFLYKIGELYLSLNRVREATTAWEKIVKEGKDGTWKKLAAERLDDLAWRLKMSRELPGRSKF